KLPLAGAATATGATGGAAGAAARAVGEAKAAGRAARAGAGPANGAARATRGLNTNPRRTRLALFLIACDSLLLTPATPLLLFLCGPLPAQGVPIHTQASRCPAAGCCQSYVNF